VPLPPEGQSDRSFCYFPFWSFELTALPPPFPPLAFCRHSGVSSPLLWRGCVYLIPSPPVESIPPRPLYRRDFLIMSQPQGTVPLPRTSRPKPLSTPPSLCVDSTASTLSRRRGPPPEPHPPCRGGGPLPVCQATQSPSTPHAPSLCFLSPFGGLVATVVAWVYLIPSPPVESTPPAPSTTATSWECLSPKALSRCPGHHAPNLFPPPVPLR
jgi:hypothetical protein